MAIGRTLGLDGTELWAAYERDAEHLTTSGAADRLPDNRFALKRVRPVWVACAAAALIILGYGAMNFDRFLGRPTITIDSPKEETTVTTENPLRITGRIDPRDALSIGDEEVSVERDGRFALFYPLEQGLNAIEFVVTKLLGREASTLRNVIYEPAGIEN